MSNVVTGKDLKVYMRGKEIKHDDRWVHVKSEKEQLLDLLLKMHVIKSNPMLAINISLSSGAVFTADAEL